MTEPIEMPLGLFTGGEARNRELGRVQIPTRERILLRGCTGTVDILKVTRKGTARCDAARSPLLFGHLSFM